MTTPQPPAPAARPNCCKCGRPIYQGVLCAECWAASAFPDQPTAPSAPPIEIGSAIPRSIPNPPPASTETATPETDAAAVKTNYIYNTSSGAKEAVAESVPAERARSLETRLTAALAKVAELEKQLESDRMAVKEHAEKLIEQRNALEAELAELREDKARLDWLEANPLEIGWVQFNGKPLNIFLRQSLNRGKKVEDFETFRAAIDAARACNEEGG